MTKHFATNQLFPLLKYMMNRSQHVLFRIIPFISPRSYIIPWAYWLSGWYYDLGLIKGMRNIDYYMAFFISYPLSARGHDIWTREFKKIEHFKFSFNFNVVFCKVFIFKYLFAISLEKGVQILQFCIFEMCINFIFFYPILIVFLLLLNGLCWELSVVCPWIF